MHSHEYHLNGFLCLMHSNLLGAMYSSGGRSTIGTPHTRPLIESTWYALSNHRAVVEERFMNRIQAV